VAASLVGLIYLGSGIEGNLLLRQALSTRSATAQRLQAATRPRSSSHAASRAASRSLSSMRSPPMPAPV